MQHAITDNYILRTFVLCTLFIIVTVVEKGGGSRSGA